MIKKLFNTIKSFIDRVVYKVIVYLDEQLVHNGQMVKGQRFGALNDLGYFPKSIPGYTPDLVLCKRTSNVYKVASIQGRVITVTHDNYQTKFDADDVTILTWSKNREV